MTTATFTVFPAVDLRGGQVVRLAQGAPDRQTVYSADPAAMARRWQAEGAEWLHVINLDGAFGEDTHANAQALAAVVQVGLKVELGGGLRDEAGVQAALDLGAARIFLGTAALQNPALVEWAVRQYGPERVAGDIGVRGGQVQIKGWQEAAPLTAPELGRRLRAQGVTWCVLTDVARDGVSAGVNVAGAVELQNATGLQVVASGGVASLADVQRACAAGLAGVIVGRALYEGQVSLKELLQVKP